MRTTFSNFSRCITPRWLVLVVLLTAALLPATSSAQTCLQDEYNKVNSQKLNCTANDVRVAKAINVRDLSGNALTSCINGSKFNFIADFLVTTSSTSSRSNVGLYFSTGDINTQPTALTGSCSDNIIPPTHKCTNAVGVINSTVTCGSTSYNELDGSASDNCGDTTSQDPTVCLDATNHVVACGSAGATQTFPATEVVTVEIDDFTCSAPAGTNQVQLPNCTSWQIPGKTITCSAAAPAYLYPFDASSKPEAIPGSPSKCNCATIPLGITVQSPQIAVTKACTTAATTGNTNTTCDLQPEGGDVTYTVSITNQSNFGDVIVDQICDNRYGNIFTASGFTPACTAGTVGTINSTSCAALDIPATQTKTCTFVVTQAENLTVVDTVNVSGHGASAGTFGPTSSNSVTVNSHEALTTGTIVKSLVNTTNGCVTVRYGVDVKNTSANGTDETLTLSALNDTSFGNITKCSNNPANGCDGTNTLVLGTTCGVASGEGSLNGSGGAGALPKTLAVNGGDYTCQFDAQFCGALTTIVATPGTCNVATSTCTAGKVGSCTTNADCNVTCTGIEHTNIVGATLTDDENTTVSLTPGTLTVDQCFPPATSH